MRQFLLAASVAYPSALPLKAGEFAVTTLVNGVETISADGAAVKDTFYLNLKKASGDTVVFLLIICTFLLKSLYMKQVVFILVM